MYGGSGTSPTRSSAFATGRLPPRQEHLPASLVQPARKADPQDAPDLELLPHLQPLRGPGERLPTFVPRGSGFRQGRKEKHLDGTARPAHRAKPPVENLRIVDDQQVPAAKKEWQLRKYAVADLAGRAGQGHQSCVASMGRRVLRDKTLGQLVFEQIGPQGVSPEISVPG